MRINRGRLGVLRERLLTVKFLAPTLTLLFIAIVTGFTLLTKDRAMAATCPCTVFNETPTPNTFQESAGIEVGLKFKTTLDGYISGVRFFKTSNMGGAHTASLWDTYGQRIAQIPFGAETETGWQEVNFTPVPVTANTIYTASVFMANGQYNATGGYFNNDIITEYLTVPRQGTASDAQGNAAQGMYNASGSSVYPTSSFNATNYWVDVSFIGSIDTGPPEIVSKTPEDDATDVNLGDTVTATFDQTMNVASISASTFSLQDSLGNPVSATVSYDAAAKKASLVVEGGFTPGETYTATLKGGAGVAIETLNGIKLASDYSWSFTAVAQDQCPCTLKDRVNPAGAQYFDEVLSGVEIGVKIVPQGNGYIQSLRFYKPIIASETTHIGNIWDKNGTKLASVTFTGESDYGWQEAKFATPVRVYEGQPYVISYGTTEGQYISSVGGLNTAISSYGLVALETGNAGNAASGSNNANGVFSTTMGNYPASASPNGAYYWIDAVYTIASSEVVRAERLASRPLDESYGIPHTIHPGMQFSRPIDETTVTSENVQLLHNGMPVAGVPEYNEATHEIVFVPAEPLAYGGQYTFRVAADVTDLNNIALGQTHETTFTIGSEHAADIADGLGGPVLVVTDQDDLYGKYYAEILKTEGVTYFDVKDKSELSETILESYKLVLIAEMELTQEQGDMLAEWVENGGNLVAMRPDKKLADLMGLVDGASTRTNQYIKIDTSDTPGIGLTSETMQFKGTADNYLLSDAVSVADFYSDASTASPNPAVTYKEVGEKGGTAVAFTYDLAKSVIAQHQGNKAWAGINRDGSGPVRTNDLFYGAMAGDAQPDWTDMNKIHIPQADEQQRLLVNIMTKAMEDSMPMPRFWYLPHDNKAALVMAGDDHSLPASYGTQLVMNNWLNESTTGCSVDDWECVRASHYVYSSSELSNSRAVQYDSLGFEIGPHPLALCSNITNEVYTTEYANNLVGWRGKYTDLPDPRSSRAHCYSWNGWDVASKFEAANNIQYDLNYVAFPAGWINDRGTLITGSGMNMRFTVDDGVLVDVRQGVTNLDNTSASLTSVNTTLDNAIGPAGYYGIIGTHYDMSDTYHQLLFNATKSRGIPMITARQALDWLNGRENSQFSNLKATKGKVAFDVHPAEYTNGLKAMIPAENKEGTLVSLKLNGAPALYQTEIVKGVSYATFSARPGAYEVTYSDYAAPGDPGGEDPEPDTDIPDVDSELPDSPVGSANDDPKSGDKNEPSGEGVALEADSIRDEPNSQGTITAPSEDTDTGVAPQDKDQRKTSDDSPLEWLVIAGLPAIGVAVIGGAIWWWRRRGVV